jgi:hypothetical protein
MSKKAEQKAANNALRAQLAKQVETPAAKVEADVPVTMPDPPAVKPEPRSGGAGKGSPVSFWVNEEDRSILNEIGIMLYAKGIKPSDSLIVRVALRLLPRDHRLVEGAREMQEQDRRRQRNRPGDMQSTNSTR